jgi:hypothetical protein
MYQINFSRKISRLLFVWLILVCWDSVDVAESGKTMSTTIELKKIAYTELILSIDFNTSTGKVAFNLIKGDKSKDYPGGNAAVAWERLKNKHEQK